MSDKPFKDISFNGGNKTASMDSLLGSDTSSLVDRVREAKTSQIEYGDGVRVYAFVNNGLIVPGNLPKAGTKGTVLAVRTASGEVTGLDGELFIRWDGRSKIESVPSAFVRKASERVANLDDFVMLSGNSSLQAFASEGDTHLVHKSSKDLWSVRLSEDGSFDVERLFDDQGNPLKV